MRRITPASVAGILLLGCAAGGESASVDGTEAAGGSGSGGGGGGSVADGGGSGDGGGSNSDAECGDLICDVPNGEDCETCRVDCGQCPTCGASPTCTGATAAPTSTTHVPDCDNNDRVYYACGVDTPPHEEASFCIAPKLRIRVRQMHIERGGFVTDKGLYCIITGEDAAHSELLLRQRSEIT